MMDIAPDKYNNYEHGTNINEENVILIYFYAGT